MCSFNKQCRKLVLTKVCETLTCRNIRSSWSLHVKLSYLVFSGIVLFQNRFSTCTHNFSSLVLRQRGEKRRLGDSDKFAFKSKFCRLCHEIWSKLFNVFKPQCPHLENGNNDIYFTGSLWGLNKISCMKCQDRDWFGVGNQWLSWL